LIPLVLDVAIGRRASIRIYGDDYPTPDGTCVRDYVHVSDLADAHLLALDKLETESRLIYNLGNGQGFSVRELIESARRVTGHPIPAEVHPRRPGDPAVLVAGSEKAIRELGWKPRYTQLDELADGGLFGVGLEEGPAGFFGDPEDVGREVFVTVFGIGTFEFAGVGGEEGAAFFEGVGDVFEEDEAEDDVFVFGGVHVGAEFVGGLPEGGFEADGGGGVGAFAGFGGG